MTASVEREPEDAVADAFDEAERRDPERRRCWVALVDGQRHQLRLIQAETARRNVQVTIVCDFVHALEYLWKAGWCFFSEDDSAHRGLDRYPGPPRTGG